MTSPTYKNAQIHEQAIVYRQSS
jgi:hypothetical protein